MTTGVALTSLGLIDGRNFQEECGDASARVQLFLRSWLLLDRSLCLFTGLWRRVGIFLLIQYGFRSGALPCCPWSDFDASVAKCQGS